MRKETLRWKIVFSETQNWMSVAGRPDGEEWKKTMAEEKRDASDLSEDAQKYAKSAAL